MQCPATFAVCFNPLCLISSSAQRCPLSCRSLLELLRILQACIMPVVATNGKRRTVEQWSTNEVFFDRYDSTRFRQDLSPEETSMPTEHHGKHMHQLFSTSFPVLLRVFRCLIELDLENGADPEFLIAILSILDNRSHLAPVCREWSELFSDNQTLSLASLHLSAFRCHGAATEILARCTVLRNFHVVTRSLKPFYCQYTILQFLEMPWRLRVARLNKYLQKSETFSREIFGEELDSAQNFFSPETVALLEHSIVEFSAGARIPTPWPPASRRYSQRVSMQYELLNFKWGHHREVAPDEFVAWFGNVKVYPWRNLHREHGYCWAVKVAVQLSSILCLPSQIDHEVIGTCLFNFRNQSFGAEMRVFLGPRLELTLDFATIPP